MLKLNKNSPPKMTSSSYEGYTDINDDRSLYLTGEISSETVVDIIRSIHDINDNDNFYTKYYAITNCDYNPAPIKLYIDSVGGSVSAAMSLINAIETSATDVHTICMGECSSAALLIFITGHKRIAYRTSLFMYHELSSGSIGKLSDIREAVEMWDKLQQSIDEIFLAYTKFTKEELKDICSHKKDYTFDYKEAIDKGIVDQVHLSRKYPRDLEDLKAKGVSVTNEINELEECLEKVDDDQLLEALKMYLVKQEGNTNGD